MLLRSGISGIGNFLLIPIFCPMVEVGLTVSDLGPGPGPGLGLLQVSSSGPGLPDSSSVLFLSGLVFSSVFSSFSSCC